MKDWLVNQSKTPHSFVQYPVHEQYPTNNSTLDIEQAKFQVTSQSPPGSSIDDIYHSATGA